MEDNIRIVIVGDVDHGKSTIIGHLLFDLGMLPDGKISTIKSYCDRNAKPFEYAYILDAFSEEQRQGITIDMARCFFHTKKRRYTLIDTPGHSDFMKNMVTGASSAKIAFMVIDASLGICENTKKYSYLLSMLGIKHLVVLINKMDKVGYEQSIYLKLADEYTEFLSSMYLKPDFLIPVSGLMGDNLVHKSHAMSWYGGKTMEQALDHFELVTNGSDDVMRLPVQGVYKFSEFRDERRIVCGTLLSGSLRVGDEIVFYPSGKTSKIKSLEGYPSAPKTYEKGEACGFTLVDDKYIKRGEIACKIGERKPLIIDKMLANIYWCGDEKLLINKSYIIRCETFQGFMKIRSISKILDCDNIEVKKRDYIDTNEVATVEIVLDKEMACEISGESETLNRFVIVNGYDVSGGGIILGPLEKTGVNYEDGVKGKVFLLTGLSGAGKTTVGSGVVNMLEKSGQKTFFLDGDEIRKSLNSDLGFSRQDRIENIRRVAHVANMLKNAGMIVIIAMIAPYREGRKMIADIVGEGYYEVYIKASLQQCIKRDVKGFYKKALENKIENFTGVSDSYHEPINYDLMIDTELRNIEQSQNMLYDFIIGLRK